MARMDTWNHNFVENSEADPRSTPIQPDSSQGVLGLAASTRGTAAAWHDIDTIELRYYRHGVSRGLDILLYFDVYALPDVNIFTLSDFRWT